MQEFNKMMVYEVEGVDYNISDVLFSFLWSIEEEEYLDCKEIKEGVDEAISSLNEDEKSSLSEYIKHVIREEELEDNEHIKGLFKEIL